MAFVLLREHKTKLFKIVGIILILYGLQWTRSWFKGLLEWTVFADIQLISIIAAGAAVLLWLYHRREI